MAAQLLSIGMPWVITQNVVYALPTRSCVITSTAPLEKSVDGLSGWTALASGSVANGFVRCTTTSPTVTCTVATGGGGGGGTVSGDIAVTSVALGTTPSQSGAIRLSNGSTNGIKSRNGSNSTDTSLLNMNGSTVEIGQAGVDNSFPGAINYIQGVLNLSGSASNISFYKRSGTPAAMANWGQLWLRDNGSGKMQLVVQFPTGGAIQIAIEP